jgi:hypothetical protein
MLPLPSPAFIGIPMQGSLYGRSGNERANFIFNPMLNKVLDAVFYVRDREFDYRKIQPAEASAGW